MQETFTKFDDVTPENGKLLQGYKYIYVGTAGTVKIKGRTAASAGTFKATAGAFLPFTEGSVELTGTTATDIVAVG